MALFENLRGIVGSIFQLGAGGPNWKNNAGAFEARNATDSAFTIVRGAPPVGPNDFVTLASVGNYIYGPNMDFVITLAGLSDDSSFKTHGRQSNAIDLSSSSFQEVLFSLAMTSNDTLAPTAGGSIEAWWIPQRTNGSWPDTFGAVDAAVTVSSREELFAYGSPIGSVIVNAALAHTYDIESSLIKATGQRRFSKIGVIWVLNATGQVLDADPTKHRCSWQGVT